MTLQIMTLPASREASMSKIRQILDVSAVVGEECANKLMNQLICMPDEFVAETAATLQSKIDDAVIEMFYRYSPEFTACCSARTVEELIESDLGRTH